jgi:hypothetical protein
MWKCTPTVVGVPAVPYRPYGRRSSQDNMPDFANTSPPSNVAIRLRAVKNKKEIYFRDANY